MDRQAPQQRSTFLAWRPRGSERPAGCVGVHRALGTELGWTLPPAATLPAPWLITQFLRPEGPSHGSPPRQHLGDGSPACVVLRGPGRLQKLAPPSRTGSVLCGHTLFSLQPGIW